MNKKPMLAVFGILMVVLSAGMYALQNMLFNRPVDTGFYLFQDLAFLPINVLLVTIGVNAFMGYREKQEKLDKVNILVGEFFTESGYDVIRALNAFVVNLEEVSVCTAFDSKCGLRERRRFLHSMERMEITVDASLGKLDTLRDGLMAHKQNMLSMFGNPNLMEHDRFTDMLWAVYHLMDELRSRESLADLPTSDLRHLSGDIKRAYVLLVIEWALIIRHMKERYPYLYSMASRKNPFLTADVVIKD